MLLDHYVVTYKYVLLQQGYTDPVYRQRRKMIGDIAFTYQLWDTVFLSGYSKDNFYVKKKNITTMNIFTIMFTFVSSGKPIPRVEYTAEEISTW